MEEDFKFYEAVITNKIPIISISHNIITCKDESLPASLSKTWHDILRNKLNYSGLILADDISMVDNEKYSFNKSVAVLAVKAGNDIILTSNYYNHYDDVKKAVKSGDINEDIINKACRRIIAWKLKYLINNKSEKIEKEGIKEKENKESKENEKKAKKEIFEEYYKKAEEYMKNIKIEEKISQMFFPKYNVINANNDIKNIKPGGFVFFGKDFNHEEEYIQKCIKQIQNISNKNFGLPLGLAVDEEGGIENRVSTYHRIAGEFPSSKSSQSILNEILKIDKEKRELLKKFYLNINLAPIADIFKDLNNYIYIYYKGI